MKRFSLFLDFDDTLVETRHLVAQYLGKRYGIQLQAEEISDNNGFDQALKKYGVNIGYNEVYLDFGKNFFPSFDLQEFKLYPGAKEAILHLSEIYNLYIVTSRQRCEKTHIKNILRHNEILHCFKEDEIHCVWDWQDDHFVSEPKRNFVEKKRPEETVTGFIDDSIDEIRCFINTKNVASTVLFDPKRTYNKEAIGFEVFHDWKTIEKIFS